MKVLKVKDILPEKISTVFKVLWSAILTNFKAKANCDWESNPKEKKIIFLT